LANDALERAGHLERIDHRTLAAQGIERVPQIHLGANVVRMEERGLRTERADQMLHIEERNRELDRMRVQLIQIEHMREAEERGRDGADPESPTNGPDDAGPGDLAAERERPGADEPSALDAQLARTHLGLDPGRGSMPRAQPEQRTEPDRGRD